eukprot:scaffold119341_cov55-Attheya_sp.AAC.1
MAASSRLSFMDLLLDLAFLFIAEGGWVMGTEGCILGVAFGGPGAVGDAGAMARRMGYEHGAQRVDVFRLGRPIGGRGWVGGCGLGVEFGGPAGAVSSAGAMAGFVVVLGRFHCRKYMAPGNGKTNMDNSEVTYVFEGSRQDLHQQK